METLPDRMQRVQTLNEGQKIAYELVADRKTGKSSADNLRSV